MMRGAIVACLVAAGLTGCGGSHAFAPGASSGSSPGAAGTARFMLTIPAASAAAASRRAQYVSASTESGQIAVNGGTAVQLDLGTSSLSCTSANSGRTCLIVVPAPIGVDTFALTLYNGPFVSNAHSGQPLSTASMFGSTITEGSANVSVPLILSGIPASYQLVVTTEPAAYATSGAAALGTAVLNVYDASANLIVGPTPFENSANVAVTFTLGASPQIESVAVNGGAFSTTATVSAPTDSIAFMQTTASMGAQLTVTPTSPVTLIAPAFVRPAGFSGANVESSIAGTSPSFGLVAPIVDQAHGAAVTFSGEPISLVTTGAGANVAAECSSSTLVRSADIAYSNGTAWMAGYAGGTTLATFTTGCNYNAQFPAATDLGTAAGAYFLQADCTAGLMVPGVYENLGTAATNCSYVHDLVANGTTLAAIDTSTADTNDHVVLYTTSALHFIADVPITYGGVTAAGTSLVSEAARSDGFFIEETAAKRLWAIGTNNTVMGYEPLPAGYTYVSNALTYAPVAYSSRTIAIGADGLAYIAVSAPFDGLVAIDPLTAAVVATIPNVAGATSTVPWTVSADARGTIYWSAGAYVMHYPNNIP